MNSGLHRTQIESIKTNLKFDYQDCFWCIGSCFANHVGRFLTEHQFINYAHPFGIVYNPLTIAEHIDHVVHQSVYTSADIVNEGGIWSSAMHHSRYNQLSEIPLLTQINDGIHRQYENLKDINTLIITLGTAYVFTEKSTGRVVSNCHKRSADLFERRMCSVNEIVTALTSAILTLKVVIPQLKIICTVSPVRHIKNGLIGDQKSKSTLLLAAHHICNQVDNAVYLPAYEIMINDLRDYRYYNQDMIHPSPLAVDYILNYFQEQFLTEPAQEIVKKVNKINKSLSHRPFNPMSEAAKKFKSDLRKRIDTMEKEFGWMNFRGEF